MSERLLELPKLAHEADEYFRRMRGLMLGRARGLDMPIETGPAEDCRTLTTRLWLFPDSCHVRFFDADEAQGSVKYVIAPHNERIRTYVTKLTRADSKIFAGSPVHVYHHRHADFRDELRLQEKTKLPMACFLSERGFLRGLRRVENQGVLRRHYWNKEMDARANQTSFEVTTILQASCLEALLKDSFFAFRPIWFDHVAPRDLDATLRETLAERGVRSVDATSLSSLDKSDLQAAVHHLLAPSNPATRSRLNFQSLSDSKEAYAAFFGVDLARLANATMKNGWERLRGLMQQRHKIIHGYATETLEYTETYNVSSLLNNLQPALLRELRQRLNVDRHVLV